MTPIPFPEQHMVIAEGQPMTDDPNGPKFQGLPSWVSENETVSCWQLSWWERIVVLCTGRIWHQQFNWSKPLQGIWMQTQRPQVFDLVDTADMVEAEL